MKFLSLQLNERGTMESQLVVCWLVGWLVGWLVSTTHLSTVSCFGSCSKMKVSCLSYDLPEIN